MQRKNPCPLRANSGHRETETLEGGLSDPDGSLISHSGRSTPNPFDLTVQSAANFLDNPVSELAKQIEVLAHHTPDGLQQVVQLLHQHVFQFDATYE